MGGEGRYAYYGDGKRFPKTENGITTEFTYDNLNLLEERSTGNVVLARYTMGLGIDEPIKLKRGSDIAYYHTDALGSVREMTAPNQGVVNKYIYEAWGVVVSKLETVSNFITYTGRELDKSGLYFYRARHYHAKVGRFLQRDLLTGRRNYPLNWNPFVYVKNNPAKLIDPKGTKGTNGHPGFPGIPWWKDVHCEMVGLFDDAAEDACCGTAGKRCKEECAMNHSDCGQNDFEDCTKDCDKEETDCKK